MDNQTTIQELKKIVQEFREERDWVRSHGPKNMAENLCVEASELLELFLWKERDEIKEKLETNPDFYQDVKDELADVIYSCLAFALDTNIDISDAFKEKMKKTTKKYPIEKANDNKYDRS